MFKYFLILFVLSIKYVLGISDFGNSATNLKGLGQNHVSPRFFNPENVEISSETPATLSNPDFPKSNFFHYKTYRVASPVDTTILITCENVKCR